MGPSALAMKNGIGKDRGLALAFSNKKLRPFGAKCSALPPNWYFYHSFLLTASPAKTGNSGVNSIRDGSLSPSLPR